MELPNKTIKIIPHLKINYKKPNLFFKCSIILWSLSVNIVKIRRL